MQDMLVRMQGVRSAVQSTKSKIIEKKVAFKGLSSYIKVMTKQLSTRQFDYMDGLVQTKQAESFDNAIRNFIIDLVEEGFTVEDVKKYIQERIERMYFEFRGYDSEEK
jgi:hypothetical protein